VTIAATIARQFWGCRIDRFRVSIMRDINHAKETFMNGIADTGQLRMLANPITFGDTDGDPIPALPFGRKMTVIVNLFRGTVGGIACTLATGIPSEIKIKGRGVRRIVWELDHEQIGDASYEFELNNGILIVDQTNNQLPSGNGGRGDGDQNPNSRVHFHYLHRNNVARSQAIYFPIIRQTIGKEVSLCGAADPRIVND
jgi:hypothetical protein